MTDELTNRIAVTAVEGTAIIVEVQERLRQERETFDQRKMQDRRWFFLRLAMGWTAVAVLPIIDLLCAWVIFHSKTFTSGTVTAATATLLVDTVGLVGTVWKVVLGKGPDTLSPVTTSTGKTPPAKRTKSPDSSVDRQ